MLRCSDRDLMQTISMQVNLSNALKTSTRCEIGRKRFFRT